MQGSSLAEPLAESLAETPDPVSVSTTLKACLKPIDEVIRADITVEAHSSQGQIRHTAIVLERSGSGWVFAGKNSFPKMRLNPGAKRFVELATQKDSSWHAPTDNDRAGFPEWLDLAFLIPQQVATERYQIKSDMQMAGKRYVTLVADGLKPEDGVEFGQLSLSITLSEDECSLLRVVVFDRTGKLWKKVFYHWQTVQGHTVWKNMHVEHARTLGRTIYHFSGFKFGP